MDLEDRHVRPRWSNDFDAEHPVSRHVKSDSVNKEFADRSRSAHMGTGLETMAMLGHATVKREPRWSKRHAVRRLDRDHPSMRPTDPCRSLLGSQ